MAAAPMSPASLARRDALRDTLEGAQRELAAVAAELAARQQRAQRAWGDEAPALQAYADSMVASSRVMREEMEATRAQMHAAMMATGHVPGSGGGSSSGSGGGDAQVAALAAEVDRLVAAIESTDRQQAQVRRPPLANPTALARLRACAGARWRARVPGDRRSRARAGSMRGEGPMLATVASAGSSWLGLVSNTWRARARAVVLHE